MRKFFKGHTVAALIVLMAATAWVGTGEFTSVGSRQVEGAAAASGAAAAPAPPDFVAAAQAPKARVVATMVPQFVQHAREIRLSGTTQPDKRSVLAARTSGVVESLQVTQGQAVAADAVVMTLEGRDTLAAVTIAEVALDQRRRELEVAEKLFSAGNKPELQLTAARSAEATAAAQLAQARAAADRLALRAPFAGIVDKVEVELGEWIQTGTPVATVLALDPIEVAVEVSENNVASLHPGAEALVTLVSGAELRGTVRFVAKEATAQTRTFPVEVELPNPDHSIQAGMTAEVRLYADPITSVVIPRSVITLSSDGEIGLRVVGDDNRARFIAVELLDDTPAGLVVRGVPEGVRIIVAGQDLVRDGDPVTGVDAAQLPAGGATGAGK
jgi:multidrug efflux system membrane fusion protein